MPMPYFSDIQDLYDVAIELFSRLSEDKNIKKKALDSKLVVRFVYRDPDGELWIDCRGDEILVLPGAQELTPDATLTMDTDVAHMFWLGKLNLIKSLSSGEIASEGSIPRMLKMLPVIKPAFKIYPEIIKEKGMESILNVG
jgi:alkyl sulfatase BDS1-like metallo-beta-lactamase superfamily hydrolase